MKGGRGEREREIEREREREREREERQRLVDPAFIHKATRDRTLKLHFQRHAPAQP